MVSLVLLFLTARNDEYFIARDHMGIIPLYMGWDVNGTFYVSSELKALEGYCTKIELFPPGHYLHSSTGELVRWYERDWMDFEAVKENQTSIEEVGKALEDAVHRQLMSDVPYGVLLSGGLDSSVTSAIAKKYALKRVESGDTSDAWWPQLHSFSVGLEGSPDLAAARKVADHIGTVHHEIVFTIQEGLDAIKDVIYNLETYDITTVRASTPMYLMARVIKSMGIKMVLSGEGADELVWRLLVLPQGSKSAKDFHEETVRKTRQTSYV
jgi:asparagine synthase (glutamine-hydrolysing)